MRTLLQSPLAHYSIKGFHYHMHENLSYKEKYTMREEATQFSNKLPDLHP